MYARVAKAFIALTAVGFITGAVFTGAGAQNAATETLDIRVVDMPRVMKDYELRAQRYSALEQKVGTLQAPIDALSASIEADRERLQTTGADMSEEERFELQNKIESEYARYQTLLSQNQRQIDLEEEKVLREIIENIDNAVSTIAEARGYEIVLNSQANRGNVMYYSTNIDITSQVLEQLNK